MTLNVRNRSSIKDVEENEDAGSVHEFNFANIVLVKISGKMRIPWKSGI